jgi:hypothetical protein
MSGPSSPDLVSLIYDIGDQHYIVTLDASVNEAHQGSAQVTEHPVETGAAVTDNIRPLPRRLTIEGVVSNTPIYAEILSPTRVSNGDVNAEVKSTSFTTASGKTVTTPKGKALQFSEKFDRVKDVYEALVGAYQNGSLITIATTLQRYDSFAITALNVPRNVDNSNAIQFTIDFQEILTVDVQEVESLAAKHQEKKRGAKPTKAPEAAKEKDIRKAMIVSVGQWLGALK